MAKTLRRIPVVVWLGIGLLAFSFAGVIWVMNLAAAEKNGSAGPPPQVGPSKVACSYAYGDVESGVAKLYTLQPGRVVEVAAHDNDVVEKDAVLVRLDDTVAKADLQRARAAVTAAEASLSNAKKHAELLRKEHAAKIDGQKAVIAGKKAELEDATNKRDKAKDLAKKGGLGVSQKDVEVADASVSARQQALAAEEKSLRILETTDPELASKVADAEAQLTDRKQLVAKAEFALRECTITAPDKGTVLRVLVSRGDVLGPTPREPAVMFCPDKPRILRAEVEQEFASRLVLNQTVVIRDDSSNSPLFTGKVTRISDWYSHRRSMVQEPLQFNDVRTQECIITPDPNDKPPIRIGQRVRVTFEAAN
jgi:multidrug resistance efflux pump